MARLQDRRTPRVTERTVRIDRIQFPFFELLESSGWGVAFLRTLTGGATYGRRRDGAPSNLRPACRSIRVASGDLFSFFYQFDQAELLGHMECLAHGWLPRDAVRMRGRAPAAEEVDAQRVARPGRACVNLAVRNLHRGIPDMFLRIDLRQNLEA